MVRDEGLSGNGRCVVITVLLPSLSPVDGEDVPVPLPEPGHGLVVEVVHLALQVGHAPRLGGEHQVCGQQQLTLPDLLIGSLMNSNPYIGFSILSEKVSIALIILVYFRAFESQTFFQPATSFNIIYIFFH